jgi:hypothetical protein
MLLVVVGDHDPEPLQNALGRTATVTLRAKPSRDSLNAALDQVEGGRLVVAADDAGVGAVMRRLLVREQLADTPIALLPVAGPGLLRSRLGLPAALDSAAAVVRDGTPALQGLVRDDHGGVTLGQAALVPASGVGLGVRAYVDEHELVNATVPALTVTPQAAQLAAVVELPRRLRRSPVRRELAGRAVTASCDEAKLIVDGVQRGQTQTRCTWWFEPDRWQVVLP